MNDILNTETKLLRNDSFFFGVVTSADAGTYTVQVAPKGQTNIPLVQGIPLASIFAQHLGFKECFLPQPGCEVLCFRTDFGQCVIFGIVPTVDKMSTGQMMPARALIGGGDSTKDSCNSQGYGTSLSKLKTFNATRPTDMRQGELAFANEFGVMLGLFQNFATIKGSELAQIQTFFLDDLVRIISHNFQHYTALGEFKIFHDGNTLQMEVGMSHDPKESLMGAPQVTGETTATPPISHNGAPNEDDINSFYTLANDRQVGIERLKAFIGSLGDFINVMIVRPHETATRALDGAVGDPDLGLSNIRVGTDGEIVVRTVKGLHLEKTNWIRVPRRIRSPEDPEGDDPTTSTTKEAFQFNRELVAKEQPYMYFLQMRDYLAYINDELAYKNFTELDKDFDVNDDYTLEKGLRDVTKVHANYEATYERKTANISIMPNGGIMFKDAWGSAIIMEGGNIYIQPAKDIVHQPMRNFIAKVGGSMSISAQEELDMSSTNGGFRLKTENSQYFYSDNSGILLHAGGENQTGIAPEDGAYTAVGGIVMHAPDTTIVSHSKYKLDRATEAHTLHNNYLYNKSDEGLILLSPERIDLHSEGTMNLSCMDNLTVSAEGAAYMYGESSTIVGMKDQTYGIAKFGLGFLPVQGFLDDENIEDIKEYSDEMAEFNIRDTTPLFQEDEEFEELKFKFLSTQQYGITLGVDYLPQTIAQQEDESFTFNLLRDWEEQAVNETYPYPGVDFKDCLVKSSIQNIENIEGELVNKTEEHNTEGTLDIGADIFTTYKTL